MCLTRFACLDLKFPIFYRNMHAAIFYRNMHYFNVQYLRMQYLEYCNALYSFLLNQKQKGLDSMSIA